MPYRDEFHIWDGIDGAGTCIRAGDSHTISHNGAGTFKSAICAYDLVGKKVYAEFKYISGTGVVSFGVTVDRNLSLQIGTGAIAFSYSSDGHIYINNSETSGWDTLSTGDILGLAIDETNGKIWYSINGVWYGDPVAGTGEATNLLIGASKLYFGATVEATNANANIYSNPINCIYTAPTGFEYIHDGSGIDAALPGGIDVYTTLMIHSDTTNGDNVIVDSEGTLSFTASALVHSTSAFKFGTTSIRALNGDSSFMSINSVSTTLNNLGNQVSGFTYDFWLYISPTWTTGDLELADLESMQIQTNATRNNMRIVLNEATTGSVILYIDKSMPLGTWFHVSLEYDPDFGDNGMVLGFINGTLYSGTQFIGVPKAHYVADTSQRLIQNNNPDAAFYIDEIRYSNKARHQSNFSVMTEAYSVAPPVISSIIANFEFAGSLNQDKDSVIVIQKSIALSGSVEAKQARSNELFGVFAVSGNTSLVSYYPPVNIELKGILGLTSNVFFTNTYGPISGISGTLAIKGTIEQDSIASITLLSTFELAGTTNAFSNKNISDISGNLVISCTIDTGLAIVPCIVPTYTNSNSWS